MQTTIPAIRGFPKDDRRWRVDWLGAVVQNQSSSFEPLIYVYISPVKEGVYRPQSEKHIEKKQQRKIAVGVGQLPFIHAGSIWMNGRIQREQSGTRYTFNSLDLSPDSLQVIAAGSEETEKRYIIPPFIHNIGLPNMGSNCLAIRVEDDPYALILPVTEVLRFYYAPSTHLAYAAFFGGYQHDLNHIVNDKLTGIDKTQGHHTIRLRRWLEDNDAWTVARILFDDIAFNGVQAVHDSLIAGRVKESDSASQRGVHIKCDLPFQGFSDWSFRAIRFKSHTGNTRSLILNLENCSAPFPFTDLEVTRDNDSRQADSETDIPDEEKIPAWAAPRPSSTTGQNPSIGSDHEPEDYTSPVKISLAKDRFKAIENKEIIKKDKDDCKFIAADITPISPVVSDDLSTGEGSSGGEGIPAELSVVKEREKALPASFEVFEEAVFILNSYEGVSARIRSGERCLALLSSPLQRQWQYLDNKTKTKRRVIVADIVVGNIHYCISEFEKRSDAEKRALALLARADGGIITEQFLSSLLFHLSVNEGVWKLDQLSKQGFIGAKLNHSWSTTEGFASNVLKKIKKMMSYSRFP